MRTLSPAAIKAVVSPESEEVFLQCLTIVHPDMDTIRIVNNTDAVIRAVDGLLTEWVPYPFNAPYPDDDEDAPKSVDITIDNVDRQIARKIRDLVGIPQATLELVMASSPDYVELGPFDFSIKSAQIDQLVVTLSSGYIEDFANQGIPAQTYNPSNSKGLFP